MRCRAVGKSATAAAIRQLDLLFRVGFAAGLSDGQLLERFAARDGGMTAFAFEALVHRHGPMVLATCRGVLRHEHDAEDAFQATFLVLARRAGTLRRTDRVGPWLHRVALRVAERSRAASALRRDREARAAGLSALAAPGPERGVEREELRKVVHQEVDRLPERDRLLVVLCDLQGESYEAAAAQLRVPVGTVRSRLSRARERLRVRIDRRGLALPAGVAALTASEASAAVPAHLIASAVSPATLAAAGGLSAGTASAAALAYAEGVIKSGGLISLGKAAVAVAVLGAGLACAGAGVIALRERSAAVPVEATAVPSGGAATAAPPPPWRVQADLVRGPRRGAVQRQGAEQLLGRWIVVEAEQHGTANDLIVGDRLVIEGGRFAWTAARGEPERIFFRGTTRGRITVDPDADPRRIDLNESGRTILAIYRLEADGDRLVLCVGDPDGPGRPRSFASDPDSRQLLLVYKRDGTGGRRVEPALLEGGARGKDGR
jgi:RNA polymerase sigma factor (sigma-70 family)